MNTTRIQAAWRIFACMTFMAGGSALGQTFNASTTYTLGNTIPDGPQTGIAFTENFSAPSIAQITDLSISLDISGGFNGDYYAYIADGSGFSVLLNRVGRDPGTPLGYADSGMDVTLTDSAANNIHNYQLTQNPAGGELTGTWAPDGRNTDPTTVTSASPVNADLSSFTGLNPNGQWTLFIADEDPGAVGTIESFTIDVTGTAAPDGFATSGLLAIAAAGLLAFRRFAPNTHLCREFEI